MQMHDRCPTIRSLHGDFLERLEEEPKPKPRIPWLLIVQGAVLFLALSIGRKVITDISANIGGKVRGDNPNLGRKALAYVSEAVVAEIGASV